MRLINISPKPTSKYIFCKLSGLYLLFESVSDFFKVFNSEIFCNQFIVRYV